MRTGAVSPPGPRIFSPLGIAPRFARDPLGVVAAAFQAYGDCVHLPGPLGQSAYLLNDPDLVRTVLVTHANDIEKPAPLKRIFRSSFGNGLFFSEGSFWRRQRKLAQPAFHSTRIQAYAASIVRQAQHAIGTWRPGQLRDLRREMSAATLKVVVEALFHTSVEGEMEQIYLAMNELASIITMQSMNPLLAIIPDAAPIPLMRRKRRASAVLDSIIYRLIRERRASRTDNGDLLSMLVLAEDEDGQHMSERQLHDEVMTIFIAGHETTALALTWAFVLLARHPSVEAKLHAEVDQALDGRLPTLADLPNLPYAQMVVKETLRLYPPVWLIIRQAVVPFSLGTYPVSKGSQIWVCPFTMHRHPRLYDQPEGFLPERFLPDHTGQALELRLPRFAYMPFGGGPRICMGNMFALMEAQLFIATIAQRYHLEMDPDSKIQVHAGATLGFKDGAPLRVVERT